MNLINTLLVYMTLLASSSVQQMPAMTPKPVEFVTAMPTQMATPYVAPTTAPTVVVPPPATSVPVDPSNVILAMGDRGENVRVMQRRLIELGYLKGKADGIFGKNTKLAVERFQNFNALKVDGIAGPKTLKKLYHDTNVVPAPAGSVPTAAPAPVTPRPAVVVQVPISYTDEKGTVLHTETLSFQQGVTTYKADDGKVPDGYTLKSSREVVVTVDAAGKATPSAILFVYVAPQPTEVPTEKPTDKPTETAAPATDEPTETATPATDEPTETTTPATDEPTETATPATDEPTETATPATDEPTETTTPATDEPTETAAPATDEPTETAAPATDEPTETAAPATDEPTETAAPATDEPTETTAPATDEPIETAAPATDEPEEPVATPTAAPISLPIPVSGTISEQSIVLTAPTDNAYGVPNAVALDASAVRVYGKVGDWLMIGFTMDNRLSVGYVKAAAVSIEGTAADLSFMSERPKLLNDAKLTDDPDGGTFTMATLPKDGEVRLLGILNGWAYVETAVDGKTARGFVDKTAVGR